MKKTILLVFIVIIMYFAQAIKLSNKLTSDDQVDPASETVTNNGATINSNIKDGPGDDSYNCKYIKQF